MHMADALISPAVGGVMWGVTALAAGYSLKKLQKEDVFESKRIPLMGVAGAFIFAAQMINFTIPATGSSGHLGGGLLLAALLGPHAGLLVISVVLAIQALFFADGGLLALGCNIFNMGFLTCFIAYPLVFKPIIARGWNKKNLMTAAVAGAILGLSLGAAGVVVETVVSGVTELSLGTFAALMLPIHLAIGAVEGIITGLVLVYVYSSAPDLLNPITAVAPSSRSWKKTLVTLAVGAFICASCLHWFASVYPDGLEWSIMQITGFEELESDQSWHGLIGGFQEKTSIMPDYNFKDAGEADGIINIGGSVSGVVGSSLVLLIVMAICYAVKIGRRKMVGERL